MIAWVYLDKKMASIDALKDFDSMEYIIRNYEIQLVELRDKAVDTKAPIIGFMSKNKDLHLFESRTVNLIDEIDVLKERYRRAVEYMKWFRPAWEELNDEEQYVLSEFYINDTNAVKNICEKFEIERSSAYNKKNRALNKLAVLLYGK